MICHVTVQTEDLNSSIEFYDWLLGMTVAHRFEIPNGEIAFLGKEETKFEIIYNKDYKKQGDSKGVTIGFKVDCLEEKIEMLKGKGIEVSPVISPNPHTRFIFFVDLNGIKIQLVENK